MEASHLASGSGGDGYQGKIYVLEGSCPNGHRVASEIDVAANDAAYLVRDACANLPRPKRVDVSYTDKSRTALTYAGKTYTASSAAPSSPAAVATFRGLDMNVDEAVTSPNNPEPGLLFVSTITDVTTIRQFDRAGSYTISVSGFGQSADGIFPQVQIVVDGVVIGSTEFNVEWQPVGHPARVEAITREFSFNVEAGLHEINILYTNDYFVTVGDRNFFLGEVSIR